MRTKYKPWAKPYLLEHKEIIPSIDEFAFLNDFYLEIGSGKGQFILDMAKKFPDREFIAIEKNITCAGFTAKKIIENELNNVKLIPEDAEKVLPLFKEHSVKTIYLNFSDPWPKVRHHKRRLTSNKFLDIYKKILSIDGLIIQKTDNLDLFNYSYETFKEAGFKIIEKDVNYMTNENEDVLTEYEKSFRDENLPIYRMKIVYE